MSSGGKSTLLVALAAHGVSTVAEPGRAIVREQLASGGAALPWRDRAAFGALLAEASIAAYDRALALPAPVLCDRGLPDALAWYDGIGAPVPAALAEAAAARRYAEPVLLAPPWRAIYARDAERPKPFEEAEAEHHAIATRLAAMGYATVELPRASVAERVLFVLDVIDVPTAAN